MREQQLAGCEDARVRFGNSRPIAKERDLYAVFAAGVAGDPARDVPPLDPKRGVRSVISRKDERARLDTGIVYLRERRDGDCEHRHGEEPAPPHCTSRAFSAGALTSRP
jgi:hypothetical protein